MPAAPTEGRRFSTAVTDIIRSPTRAGRRCEDRSLRQLRLSRGSLSDEFCPDALRSPGLPETGGRRSTPMVLSRSSDRTPRPRGTNCRPQNDLHSAVRVVVLCRRRRTPRCAPARNSRQPATTPASTGTPSPRRRTARGDCVTSTHEPPQGVLTASHPPRNRATGSGNCSTGAGGAQDRAGRGLAGCPRSYKAVPRRVALADRSPCGHRDDRANWCATRVSPSRATSGTFLSGTALRSECSRRSVGC